MPEQLRMAFPVLWPAMSVIGVLMLVAWWPRWDAAGAPVAPTRRGWAGALAFGLGFAAAFVVIVNGMPLYPPPEKWQWILVMVGAATAFGVAAGIADRALPVRWFLGFASAVCVGWLFHPIASIENPLLVRGVIALAAFITWACLESSGRVHRGFVTPLLLSVMFTGASLVILHGGNANISLLAAAMSAGLGVVTVIGLLLPPLCLGGGASHVLAATLVALCATGWMYGLGTPVTLGLVAAAPLTMRVGELLASRASGWKLFFVRFACVAIPAGIGVALAMIAAAKSSGEDYGY